MGFFPSKVFFVSSFYFLTFDKEIFAHRFRTGLQLVVVLSSRSLFLSLNMNDYSSLPGDSLVCEENGFLNTQIGTALLCVSDQIV